MIAAIKTFVVSNIENELFMDLLLSTRGASAMV